MNWLRQFFDREIPADKGTANYERAGVEWWAAAISASAACIMIFVGRSQLTSQPDTHPGLLIPVSAFEWTSSCPQRDYSKHLDVPDACVKYQYKIDNPNTYGLNDHYKAFDWYRIGNSAFLLSCFGSSKCIVQAVVKNRFATR